MRLLSSPFSRTCPAISLRSAHGFILLPFLFLYLLLIYYCRTHYFRDPTSAFFDASRAYEPIYSRFRSAQGKHFIQHVDEASGFESQNAIPKSNNASICVGFASMAREDVSYIEGAVGSLLIDLTEPEREDIHLVLFIPHTDPSKHPSFTSNWLPAVADRVLYYDVDGAKFDYIRKLESEGGLMREKGLFDYTYLLKACQDAGTPYVVMLEDDVVASEGWYHRTKDALHDADRQTRELGASKCECHHPLASFHRLISLWLQIDLYLRLFYTQEFLGWNSEEWFIYLFFSVVAVASVWSTLTITRRFVPQTNRLLSREVIFVLSLVCTPLCIVLFFLAGRVSMLPISPGVHQMNDFGCCSQALAFPRERVADIVRWYESKRIGFADMLLEEYANENKEIRWALTPSVFQHVGIKSSKLDPNGGDEDATKVIWNFPFELNNPIALQIEHEAALRSANTTVE